MDLNIRSSSSSGLLFVWILYVEFILPFTDETHFRISGYIPLLPKKGVPLLEENPFSFSILFSRNKSYELLRWISLNSFFILSFWGGIIFFRSLLLFAFFLASSGKWVEKTLLESKLCMTCFDAADTVLNSAGESGQAGVSNLFHLGTSYEVK